MKELILFYSYTGDTKKIAEKFGTENMDKEKENKFDICEIIDEKRPGKLSAFTAGIIKSIKGGGRKIKPLVITANKNAVRFEDYDVINVFSPVWAGHTAPPVNSALKMIPKGAKIKLYLVSQSGQSEKDSLSKRISGLGLEITAYEDIKSK